MISLEQFIGEATSAFVSDESENASRSYWDVSCNLVRKYGGNALNAAGAAAHTGQLTWARASMSDQWMEVYKSQNFQAVDPFLDSLVTGQPEFKIEAATLVKDATTNKQSLALNHELKNYGYNSLFSTCFGDAGRSDRTLIVHCSELSLQELDKEVGLDRIRFLQAIIAANINSPAVGFEDGIDLNSRLSPREREVLLWLACGYRNDEIAYRLSIAEVTLRKHLTSARLKLKARTREQAIAIALKENLITL